MTARQLTTSAAARTGFSTRVEPYDLHFSSAHFITYAGLCENLHGHNFHARIDAEGSNTPDAFVIDFVALNRLGAEICTGLHDRVLLPGISPVVRIDAHGADMWCVESYDKRFILQKSGCKILPVSNTTAEMLAWYIGDQLLARLREAGMLGNLSRLRVAVEEADRQWGLCDFPIGR